VEQAWYQLGTVYRRMHRMDEARNAMETFQKLKDEGEKHSQQSLENYRKTHPDVPEPPAPESPPAPQNPQ
jgi:hypothetical protein